jgi:hypothetical protein
MRTFQADSRVTLLGKGRSLILEAVWRFPFCAHLFNIISMAAMHGRRKASGWPRPVGPRQDGSQGIKVSDPIYIRHIDACAHAFSYNAYL